MDTGINNIRVAVDENTTKKVMAIIGINQIVTGVSKETEKVLVDNTKFTHGNWIIVDLETGERGWFPGKKD